MNNKYGFAGGIIILFMCSFMAHSEDPSSEVNFEINGIINSSACEVAPDSQSIQLMLGNVTQDTLISNGHSMPIPFSISLENCGDGINTMKMKFTPGNGYYDDNPSVMKLDSTSEASNVGIMVFYQNHPIDFSQKGIDIPIVNRKAKVQLKAAYQKMGNNIGLGEAKGSLEFEVIYD